MRRLSLHADLDLPGEFLRRDRHWLRRHVVLR